MQGNKILESEQDYIFKQLLNANSKVKKITTNIDYETASSDDIIDHIVNCFKTAMESGYFKPNAIVLSPNIMASLHRPMSKDNSKSILEWVRTNYNITLENVYDNQSLSKDRFSDSKDRMIVYTKDPFLSHIGICKDIYLAEPTRDEVENYKAVAIMKSAGILVKYPESITLVSGITT